MAAIKRRAGPGSLRDPAAAQRIRAAAGAGPAAGRAAVARRQPLGQFRQRWIPSRAAILCRAFRAGFAPATTASMLQRMERVRPRLFRVLHLGPWNIAEFKRRLPASVQRMDDGAVARPDGPGASIAGGSSLVCSARRRRRLHRGSLIEFLPGPTFNAVSCANRRLPPRREASARSAARRRRHARAFRDQLERGSPRPRSPNGSASPPDAAGCRARGIRVAYRSTGGEGARYARQRILEKRRWMLARGDRIEIRSRRLVVRRAGAAGHRRVLFPADRRRVSDQPDRFRHLCARRSGQPSLRRPRQLPELLETPLFWQALGNTLYFVVVGVPLSIARRSAPRCCCIRGWRDSSRLSAPRCSRRW